MNPNDRASPASCANCGHAFGTPVPAFCPACGQESRVRAPTFGEFVQQFGGAYFSTEGALWRTLKLLLLKPGELTKQYLAGRRKHYVLPLRLYLTLSLVLLLVAGTVARIEPFQGASNPALESTLRAAKPTVVINLSIGRVGLRGGEMVCENLPGWLCDQLVRQVRADPEAFLRSLRQANARVVANWGVVMAVLLPTLALGFRVLYANRGLRYTEHLVFALHLHSFWACMLMLMLPGWGPLTWLALAAMVLYTLLAERRVHGGRWWARLVRGWVLALLYMGLLTVAMPVAFLGALLL